ncbi:MAG: hypothetical protein V3U82_04560 [Robiginitomaculum sp.]
MKNRLLGLSLAIALTMSACATNQTRTTTNSFTAAQSSKTLLVKPDVELSVLMASGMREVRANWSQDGEKYLTAALVEALKARGSDITVMDPNEGLTPRQIQIIKLNDAVVQTSLIHDYQANKLPTKKDKFDRTIGPGAMVLKGSSGADYALMIKSRGAFQSGGKMVMNIAMAALGGPVQTGGTTLYATLVDLETGDIVWSNLAGAAMGADMRKPEGAKTIVKSLMKDFPL